MKYLENKIMDIKNLNIKTERLNFQVQGRANIKEYPSKNFKIARTCTNQFKTQVGYNPLPSEPHNENHNAKVYKEKGTTVIDLRGLTRNEAMQSCDRFLSENSGQRVEIIVGKESILPKVQF